MACFLVPAGEALVVKAVEKVTEKKVTAQESNGEVKEQSTKIPFSRKLHWLCNLLLGGSVLLLFEHIWHGEIVPYFPFLTAMANAEDASAMFHEMATVGVAMAVLMTVVWAVMCVAADAIVRRKEKEQAEV